MNGSTVLIVDDERTLARSIKVFLTESGYNAEVAGTAEQALEMLEKVRPDVIFLDVKLPGMSGIELLQRIRDYDPALPVVMMTAFGTIAGAVDAVKRGAFDYLKKPVDLDELRLLADRAREHALMRQELSYYRGRTTREAPFAGTVGSSPAMRAVLDRARQVAALDEVPPILITGETGTGKGLVARSIHASGPRASKPFIEVNCAALPGPLMEAEVFGHEPKIGLFEAAEGGFLFLDEIGDVEVSLQGKLLRAIEERVVRRVGGVRDRKVDVRILSATNRDLEREAHAGRFRKDLYFRLAAILLRLPPLRDRGEDVLLLAEEFLRRFSVKYGRDVNRIDTPAREALVRYSWPGNVRELSHVIERAVLWSQGQAIEAEHLSLIEPEPARPSGSELPPPGVDLAQWERSVIETALRESGGNQTRAAHRLGISRDTLRYRIKKFGISG
jgi:two-component system, NtrC family, response regulator AtoC